MKNKRKLYFIVFTTTVVYALLLLTLTFAECNTQNSAISSYFDAFWYSIATFSTVGYGDLFPISLIGKIIGFTFILFGVGFLGIVIGHIANLFRKRSEKRRLGLMGTDFINHVIIIGWDAFSADVAKQLVNADRKVAVMTENKNDIDLIYQQFDQKELFVCFSDLSNYSSLKLLNAEKASVAFLNNGGDSDKLISILNIKKLYPDLKFVVILENSELKETFVNAGVTYVLSKNEIASKLLASYIFEPAVADFTQDLLTSTNNELEYDIQQYRVIETNPYKDTSYGNMFFELKEKYNIIAIGLKKGNGQLKKVPDNNEKIEQGDDVVVIANGATEKVMQKLFKVYEGI